MTDEKRNSLSRATQKKPDSIRPVTRSTRQEQKRRTVQSEESAPKKQFWVQIRLLPIWLRVVLVLLLLIGAAIFGAMIGYGYIGDGEPGDVLKKETWIHILDIITGKES
jgi:hypothetical protein